MYMRYSLFDLTIRYIWASVNWVRFQDSVAVVAVHKLLIVRIHTSITVLLVFIE